MKFPSFLLALMLAAVSLPRAAMAEDIDLFLGGTPGTGDLPNLLIVLDNAANFEASAAACSYEGDTSTPSLSGTAGGIEQCALHNVIRSLPVKADGSAIMNIGLMAYNATNIRDINNTNCGGANGGCLMVPLRPMTNANKASMLAWIKSWRTSGGAGNGYIKATGKATGAATQEAWAYYAGKAGLSGRNYAAIKPAVGCASNYIVFIGNAFNNSGTPGDTGMVSPRVALEQAVAEVPGAQASFLSRITGTYPTACVQVSGSQETPLSATLSDNASQHDRGGFYADEWSRFMYAGVSGPKIVTYAVGLINRLTCKPDYPALLANMAAVGGGKYFSTTNYSELATALGGIISEIRADNSVFASVSLPVSVNTQGTYLNQVFIGMFRPDGDAQPRWAGNLKQYKLGLANPNDPDSLRLVDAADVPAISSSTGFITDCARSFWTPSAVDSYFAFKPTGDCLSVAGDEVSNFPDGQWVEKGGQAYVQRRNPFARSIRACASLACASLSELSPALFTNAQLGVSSDAERTSLVNWATGQDVDDEDRGLNPNVARPSLHGDVVHSRPVAINFGTDASPRVVVFYGANDGLLKAVNGNRAAAFGGKDAGAELWAFLPQEFYPSLRRLRDNARTQNSDRVKFFGSAFGTPKPYGLDGPITAWRKAVAGGSAITRLYATARRGGRVIYAFDVSGVANDTMTQPSLLWRVGCPNNLDAGSAASDAGCTSGYEDLGQTWASPAVMEVPGHANPVIAVGGGYDPCEDTDSATTACTSSAKGRTIFLIDAVTGAVLKKLTLPGGASARSIVADVFVVKDLDTGEVLWAYTVDLGGNIYRLSGANANVKFGATAPADWTITRVASLGPGRKFHFAPDIVANDDGTYSLLLGSGDREKPLTAFTNAFAAQNYFFMVKDNPTSSAWLEAERAKCGGNAWICLDSLKPVPPSGPVTLGPSDKGWALRLNTNGQGEQVVTSAITVFGVTTFSTHRATDPAPGVCSTSLGEARVYNVSYQDAVGAVNEQGARSERLVSGGLPPSPVAGKVKLDSGQVVPFLIGGSGASALEGSPPKALKILSRPKTRKYWFIQK